MASIVVGGAGFLGSALVEVLIARRQPVVIVDTLQSGSLTNTATAIQSGRGAFAFWNSPASLAQVRQALEVLHARAKVVFDLADAPATSTRIGAELAVPVVALRRIRESPPGMEARTASAQSENALICRGIAYGPRMRRRPSALVYELFAACAAGEPLPIRGIEGVPLEVSSSRRIAHDLVEWVEAGKRHAANLREADAVVTTAEFAATLSLVAGIAMRTRPANPASVPLATHQVPPAAADAGQLESSLAETLAWFRGLEAASVSLAAGASP
ncbi:MAG TPA: NAD-dependent epimerase/dehydratase family protein [Candidatus Sulfotelmatobacter sp.]|nr:NAD-dependent epimerase/dehydratase family protein [Candidatus Sulfotelmatobacter sp.]